MPDRATESSTQPRQFNFYLQGKYIQLLIFLNALLNSGILYQLDKASPNELGS